VDMTDDYVTDCGSGAPSDMVYAFTTTAPQDVRISAVSDSGDTMSFSVQSTCGASTSQVRCTRGRPATSTLHELPAGSWFIVVEGSSLREVDFTLNVEIAPPTPASVGDSCATAIPLVLGTNTLGTLADKEDDLSTTCSVFLKDAVYSYTLTERSNVSITVDGGTSFMYQSVRTTCDDSATKLRCTSGFPSAVRLLDQAPGTYFVIVESSSGTGFNILVEASAPTPVTVVTGNENCTTAHPVTLAGGLFAGDTTTMLSDIGASCGGGAGSNDAVFVLTLGAVTRVVASTEGSAFDTVLHLHQGTCTSGADVHCDDDGGAGTSSRIDTSLNAGTWYIVVDGFGTGSAGAYLLDLQVGP